MDAVHVYLPETLAETVHSNDTGPAVLQQSLGTGLWT